MAVKCVFLGYHAGTKGYRLWLRGEKGFKTLNSREVVFNENEFPCLMSHDPISVEEIQNSKRPKFFDQVELVQR